MGLRRRSREKALQILYSKEFNKLKSFEEILIEYWKYYNLPISGCSSSENRTTIAIEGEEQRFVRYLIGMVEKQWTTIEALIEKAAISWRMDRIALIERNILRLAVAELLDDSNGIPYKATINEAIDIAKKFGNKESSAFVNGIINKVADMLEIKQRKI